MATPLNDESIQFQIYLDAAQALSSINELMAGAANMNEVFEVMAKAVVDFSVKTGMSLTATQTLFKRVIADAQGMQEALAGLPTLEPILAGSPQFSALRNVSNPFTAANPLLGQELPANMLEDMNAEEAALLKELNKVGLTMNEAFSSVNARVKEIVAGMQQAEKGGADLERGLNRAADAAARTAAELRAVPKILGKGIEDPQQAKAIVDSFKALNSLDFSKIGQYKANVTSLMGQIKALNKQTGASFEEIGKHITQNFQNVPKVALTDAMKGLNKELSGVDTNARKAAKGIDAVRIALGAIVAMIVFQAIQAVGNFFRSIVQGASDAEMALYRLQKVEESLSKEGVNVTPKGLATGLEQIKEQFSFLSDVDISQLLGNVGLLTKELGLTEQQIIDLSKAIVVMNIRSQETESVLQTSSKVITAMITGQARGVSTLGLSFSDATLQAKGLELGILKVGQSLADLTDKQKAQIKVAVALDVADLADAEQSLKDSIAYQETLEGSTNSLKSAWEDFTAEMGKVGSPVIKEGFKILIFDLKIMTALVKALAPEIAILTSAIVAVFESRHNKTSFLEEWKKAFEDIKKEMEGLEGVADTPTAEIDKLAESMAQLQEAMKSANFDDLLNDLEDFQRKVQEMEEDFQTKLTRMQEDFDRDRQRDAEDYAKDVRETQEDFARKRRDLEQKYRDNEEDAEAKFQERMRQLREKFLFNLEDALHERDARQVLRLIREYQMEKQNLINEEALRKDQAVKEHQDEMARLREEEADRLAQMAEEYRIKQERAREDYDTRVAREQLEHQTDMERLKQDMDERLKTFADKMAEELGLREGGAQAIYELLQKYYGPQGFFDGLYDYSAQSMAARAQEMLSMLQQVVAQYAAVAGIGFGSAPRVIVGTGTGGGGGVGGIGSAPRTIGKSSSFIPSSALGGGSAVPFSMSASGAQAGGGQIGIEVTLSPDLEARVVENSLNSVADVVTRTRRTK